MTRVAIVGGGASGLLVAAQLVRCSAALDVVLFEPRSAPGHGVAYSTTDEQHLLNVPAEKMSFDPDEPDHFHAWLRARGEDVEPETYAPRATYAKYLHSLLDDAPARIEHVHAQVTHIEASPAGGIVLGTGDGARATVDAVVLAMGNLPGTPLPALDLDDPRVFTSPWRPGAIEPLEPGATALVVGTGLTGVDASMSMLTRADGGQVIAISRSGKLPRRHVRGLPAAAPLAELPSDGDLDALVEAIERHVTSVVEAGGDWRTAFDGLRAHTQALWRRLGTDGQRRFMREHMRRWDVHRHRMAPEIRARLDSLAAAGRFELRAASVEHVDPSGEQLTVTLGGTLPGQLSVDRIVACTGLASNITQTGDPFVQALLDARLATTDAHGIGLRADESGRLLDAHGDAPHPIYTLGPLRRGELWETIAIPEIRVQAKRIAQEISNHRDNL